MYQLGTAPVPGGRVGTLKFLTAVRHPGAKTSSPRRPSVKPVNDPDEQSTKVSSAVEKV
jgi:hypothetical protein